MNTQAYLPFYSSQDWATDPEFALITVTEELAVRITNGIEALYHSGFQAITDTRSGVEWDVVAEDDECSGNYTPYETDYTLQAPDIVISYYSHGKERVYGGSAFVTFTFDIKHSSDSGWAEMSGHELVAYLDKAWVESYGHVFVQLPDGRDDEIGKWLCVDPCDGPDGFAVQRDSLMECIEEAATRLADTIDADAEAVVPRPQFEILRQLRNL